MAEISRSRVDIGALDQFLQAVQSRHTYLVQDIAPGALLYHYTELNALNSIVTSNDLWLTNCRYSNDEHEIKHGCEVARRTTEKALRSAKSKRPRDNEQIEFLVTVLSIVEELPPEGFYVCCFCEEDNLLSQWRSYGANGMGVSLGFNPQEFIHVTGADMPLGLMRLWKVYYEPKTQENIVRHALEHVFESSRALGVEVMARQAADTIQFFIPTFKDKDFSEEKERRLIFTPEHHCDVKPHYRAGRGMLVPYYSLRDLLQNVYGQDWRLPLVSVLVGPSERRELNVESVQMLLSQNEFNAQVTASDTPYRG